MAVKSDITLSKDWCKACRKDGTGFSPFDGLWKGCAMELGDQNLTVALFDRFPIRRKWHNGEWYYSMVDIIAALAATPSPRRYWTDFKRDLKKSESISVQELGVISLHLPSVDGRMLKTDCANRETILRIIQSIKSPNAEPFKQWLASVGALALEKQEESAQERSLRAQHRLKLYAFDTLLHEIVMFRGITSPEQHERFSDSNYSGLYNAATRARLIRERRLPFGATLEEFMGVTELVANEFQRASTSSLIEQRNLQGEEAITQAAEDVGVEMRLMMQRLGLPMPETLPRHRRLSDGEWMPEEMLAEQMNWDTPASDVEDRVIPIYEIVDEEEGENLDPDAHKPSPPKEALRLIEERHINSKEE